MEDERMAGRVKRTAVKRRGNPDIARRAGFSSEQREAMIREAAYFRYIRRGYAHGHDLEDWLAAEADVESGSAGRPEERPELEVQQGSVHGAARDDGLKRIIRRHPQKAILQLESVEPKEAPFKE